MTTLVFGARGQVGRALMAHLGGRARGVTQQEINIFDIQSVINMLAASQPDAVINAAAYTAVDKAETEENQAFKINAEAPGAMARWCATQNIPFVHYSTDYVFDGSGDAPRTEEAVPAPINAYGKSKLAGEEAVKAAGGKYLIFRTSWVYDREGKNFLNAILRRAAEREELRVVADQIGAPTYAAHLAEATVLSLGVAGEAIQPPHSRVRNCAGDDSVSGLYHLCNSGETSWHGFAEAIVAAAREHGAQLAVKRIIPIPTSEYPLPAPRPRNSRLDCGKAKRMLGLSLPSWQEGLQACMKQKYGN